MINKKYENFTVLSGEIERLTTEVSDNCGEVVTANKYILDLKT